MCELKQYENDKKSFFWNIRRYKNCLDFAEEAGFNQKQYGFFLKRMINNGYNADIALRALYNPEGHDRESIEYTRRVNEEKALDSELDKFSSFCNTFNIRNRELLLSLVTENKSLYVGYQKYLSVVRCDTRKSSKLELLQRAYEFINSDSSELPSKVKPVNKTDKKNETKQFQMRYQKDIADMEAKRKKQEWEKERYLREQEEKKLREQEETMRKYKLEQEKKRQKEQAEKDKKYEAYVKKCKQAEKKILEQERKKEAEKQKKRAQKSKEKKLKAETLSILAQAERLRADPNFKPVSYSTNPQKTGFKFKDKIG